MLLPAASLLLALLQAPPQGHVFRPAAVPPPLEEPDELDGPRPYIYYDYLEDGELRGGLLAVEPGNPLHTETGVEAMVLASPSTTLVQNGPAANRIDIVFVGDGYTSGELGQYASDVDAVWPTFFAEPPFDVYSTYFNVHRVDVVSAESGVDNDPVQGIFRNTAMDMGYWCSGIQRALCINLSKASAQAANAPDKDTILALANSGTYGGSGYTNLGAIAGHNSAAIEIALHEFGHSFASLADEYDYGGPATYSGPEPNEKNVTKLDEAGLISEHKKWVLWLDLPNVSAFEGAKYSRFGIYRPTFDSKMRNLGRPFEEFNSERFLRAIYGKVHPIDDATPAGSYPLDAAFFVDPLDPVGHALDVQWSLDGAPIPGATGTVFDAATLGLVAGQHELSVKVVDNTSMVRANAIRNTYMTEVRSWTLGSGPRLAPNEGPLGPVLPHGEAPAGLQPARASSGPRTRPGDAVPPAFALVGRSTPLR